MPYKWSLREVVGTPKSLPTYLSGMPSSVTAFMAAWRLSLLQLPFLWELGVALAGLAGLGSHVASPAVSDGPRRSPGQSAQELRLLRCLDAVAGAARRSMSPNSASTQTRVFMGGPGSIAVAAWAAGSPASTSTALASPSPQPT